MAKVHVPQWTPLRISENKGFGILKPFLVIMRFYAGTKSTARFRNLYFRSLTNDTLLLFCQFGVEISLKETIWPMSQ